MQHYKEIKIHESFSTSLHQITYMRRIKIPRAESCDVTIVYIKSWPYYGYMTMLAGEGGVIFIGKWTILDVTPVAYKSDHLPPCTVHMGKRNVT